MFINIQYIALAAIASTLVNALPLDTNQPRDVIARAKSYSVINVDGGASTQAPADATTKTVGGPTVTATVVQPVPVPATPSSSATSSSSTSQPSSTTPTSTSTSTRTTRTTSSTTQTPKPVFVTVTVTQDDGPTEYYDNGMWHTSYRIKTWETVAAPTLLSTLSAIAASSTGEPAQ